jgi:hypothetical protein
MKDAKIYLGVFRHAAGWLDEEYMKNTGMEWAVGEVLDSVYLKLYKSVWSHPDNQPLTAPTRIFFSVWIDDNALEEKIVRYNIHAFKLRQFAGYTIESKKFAAAFRESFQPYLKQWKNVSTAFGPLTLMEGWVAIDPGHFQHVVASLGNNFLKIAPLIDQTLDRFRR